MYFSHAISNQRKDFLRKTLRTMRLIILLLSTGLVQTYAATAYSQETLFTIKENNIPLKKLFKEIELSSDYSFSYRLDQVDLKEKVTVSVKGASIEAVLK